jgi:transposase
MRTCGSPEELERQRFRAIELLAAGHRPCDVADMLGVSRPSVSIWKKAYERDGPEGLKAKPHPGPTPKLNAKEHDKLAKLLLKGARAHGYLTELWTLDRIAEVIEKRFGVVYDSSSVWHVLERMGWSCQKPERRARERDEKTIARWRQKDWPRIKKRRTSRA